MPSITPSASFRAMVPSLPTLRSLMYSVPVQRLKAILSYLVPDVNLGSIEQIPSPQLARLYTLTMSDGRKLLLSLGPSLAVTLLSHEATVMSSEATLIGYVSGSAGKTHKAHAQGKKRESQVEDDNEGLPLTALVPKLLRHSSNTIEMAYPYSIYEPQLGVPLSTLSIYLSLSERRAIDKSVGRISRELAKLTSPYGTFGSVTRVLHNAFSPTSTNILPPHGSKPTPPPEGGLKSWSEAFHALLEGALRDGEDLAVHLPYETVRAHHQRLSYRLDAITLPRLVVLDAGSETNIMVERAASNDGTTSRASATINPCISVTGLCSWSQGIFGDPLISDTWDNPSESFMLGWRNGGEEVIENLNGAEVRMLLYRCYRAVVGIVTEYARPRGDSSRRELDSRRNLAEALQKLQAVDVTVGAAVKRTSSVSLFDDWDAQSRLGMVKKVRLRKGVQRGRMKEGLVREV